MSEHWIKCPKYHKRAADKNENSKKGVCQARCWQESMTELREGSKLLVNLNMERSGV